MGDTGVDINEHRETPSHPEYRMLVGLDDAFIPNPELPAADIAINTVAAWLQESPNAFSKVIFNVFSDDDRAT